VLIELKRYEEALFSFQKSLPLKPDDSEIFVGRGKAYKK
jgi:hypothetical protein